MKPSKDHFVTCLSVPISKEWLKVSSCFYLQKDVLRSMVIKNLLSISMQYKVSTLQSLIGLSINYFIFLDIIP